MRGASAASVARANSSEMAAEVRDFRLSDKLDVETACLSAGLFLCVPTEDAEERGMLVLA